MSAEDVTVIGPAVKAAGWYGPTTGLHTVAIRVANFQGRVYLDASLAPEPGAADWFALPLDGGAYIEYPRPGIPLDLYRSGETSHIALNVWVNALWLRLRVDRAYLAAADGLPVQVMSLGMVDEVLLNY